MMSITGNAVLAPIDAFYSQLHLSEGWTLLMSSLTIFIGVLALSYVSNFLTKRYLVHLFNRCVEISTSPFSRGIIKHKILLQLSRLIPAMIIYFLVPWIIVNESSYILSIEQWIQKLVEIYIIITLAMVLASLGNVLEDYYHETSVVKYRPIKSYIEIAKIVIYVIAAILVGALILNKSPVALLTGLGATTAILTVIFKDSISGLMASIQIGNHDLLRVGDQIEVPTFGANGEVIKISLNTIKVQNDDKTIVTIPTYALINTQMKNWRGMLDAGGRQIRRAINLDMHSIHLSTTDLLDKLKQIEHVQDYFIHRHIHDKNKHMTNLGLFRAYLQDYLRAHPALHNHMPSIVRQLAPTTEGLPIEIYVFSQQLKTHEYEEIQADLFDFILAILPYFELKVFQRVSDSTKG